MENMEFSYYRAGKLVNSNLLHMHAWSGCDTASEPMVMVKFPC